MNYRDILSIERLIPESERQFYINLKSKVMNKNFRVKFLPGKNPSSQKVGSDTSLKSLSFLNLLFPNSDNSTLPDDAERKVEALLALLYIIVSADENKKRFTNITNFIIRNDKYTSVNSNDVYGVLKELESFLHFIGKTVYNGVQSIVDDVVIDAYEGNNRVKGIQKLMNRYLIDGKFEIKNAPFPEVNGKRGFVYVDWLNGNNQYNVLYTTICFRNKQTHDYHTDDEIRLFVFSDDEDDVIFSDENEYHLFLNKKVAMDAMLASLLLLVDYRYEEIAKYFSDTIQDFQSQNLQEKDWHTEAMNILKERYLPALAESQKRIINRVYQWGKGGAGDNGTLANIVNVELVKEKIGGGELLESEDGDNGSDGVYDDNERFTALALLEDSSLKRIFIGGGSGTGKSTMLAQMVLKSATDLLARFGNGEELEGLLPVRISMADFNGTEKGLNYYISNCIFSGFANYDITNESDELKSALNSLIDSLLEEGHIVIFLDGLNEIPNNIFTTIKDGILQELNTRSYTNCRFIITSRKDEISNVLDDIRDDGFSMWDVCPLDENKIKRQIKNSASVWQNDNLDNIWETLDTNQELKILANNPMQLMLLLGLISDGQLENVEKLNKYQLYDRFFARIVRNEANKRGINSERKKSDLEQLLLAMAGEMLERKSRFVTGYSYIEKIENCDNLRQLHGQHFGDYIDAQVRDLVDITSLLSESGDRLSFMHDSWMEYYQARYLLQSYFSLYDSNSGSDAKRAFLENYFGAGRWIDKLDNENGKRLLRDIFGLIDSGIVPKITTGIADDVIFQLLSLSKNEEGGGTLELELFSNANGEAVGEENVRLKGSANLSEQNLPLPNIMVERIAEAVSRFGGNTLINNLILNQFNLYKLENPEGRNPASKASAEFLERLFKMATMSGAPEILDILFEPYWFKMWIVKYEDIRLLQKGGSSGVVADEEQKERIQHNNIQQKLTLIIVKNATNARYLLSKLFEQYRWMKGMRFNKTLPHLQICMIKLIISLDEKGIRTIYDEFKANYSDNNMRNIYLNYLALATNDADYIEQRYNYNCRFTLNITLLNRFLSTVNATTEDSDRFMEILTKILQTMPKGTSQVEKSVKYLLFNNKYDEKIAGYLWDSNDKESKELQKKIADLLPMSSLSNNYLLHQRFDMDVYNHLMNSQPLDDSAVQYFVYEVGEERLRIATFDLNYRFTGKFIRLKASDDNNFLVAEIKSEDWLDDDRYTVTIREKNSGRLLPKYGEIAVVTESGKEVKFKYLSPMSNSEGLEIYLYSRQVVDGINKTALFRWLHQNNAILKLNGLDCSVVSIKKSKVQNRLRLLDISLKECNGLLPKFRGAFEVYESKECGNVVILDKSIATPANYRRQLFRKVSKYDSTIGSNVRRDIGYAIHNIPDKEHIVISADAVSENLRGKYSILLDSSNEIFDGRYIVEEVTRFNAKQFAELTLSGTAMEIPLRGFIRLSINLSPDSLDDTDWSKIPYIYSFKRGENYILRIDSPIWVDMLSKESIRMTLVKHSSVAVRKQSFKIKAINLFDYPQNTSRITLKSISLPNVTGTDLSLPVEGRVLFFARKEALDSSHLRSRAMSLTPDVTRYNTDNSIKNVMFEGYEGDDGLFSFEGTLHLSPGSYVRFEELNHTNKVIGVESEGDMVRFKLEDFEKGYETGRLFKTAKLEYYQPINNSSEASLLDSVHGQLYERSVIPYSYLQGVDLLAIHKPSTDISNLYFRFEEGKAFYPVEVERDVREDVKRGLGYPVEFIKVKAKMRFDHTRSGGNLLFYYDDKGVNRATLGYSDLFYLVDFTTPQKYHRAICPPLLKECKRLGLGNRLIFKFFEERNYAAEYFRYYMEQNDEWKQLHSVEGESIKPTIAIVVSIGNTNIELFSPNFVDRSCKSGAISEADYEMGVLNTPDTSLIDSLQPDTLVYCENNGKLTPFETGSRDPLLGFRQGIVTRINRDGDAFIHVKGVKKDTYYKVNSNSIQLSEGDRVSFFPTINITIKKKKSPLAGLLKVEESVKERIVKGEVVNVLNNAQTGLRIYEILTDRGCYRSYIKIRNISDYLVRKLSNIKVGIVLSIYPIDVDYYGREYSNSCNIIL